MKKKNITDGLYQKDNGVWERVEIINNKRRSFSSKDPQKVWEKRNAALLEIEQEKVQIDQGPYFETVAEEYRLKVDKMKLGTQRSYYPAIDRTIERFKGIRMREIEPYMISEYLQSLSSMAHTTVSNHKTIINAIFQTWIDSPIWRGDINPSKLVSIPKGLKSEKRLPPTDDQVKIVKDHYMDADALPAVIYLCTGERRGEACAIRLKDIDFENKTITINKSVEYYNNQPSLNDRTKTPAGIRKIPLLKMLAEALEPMRGMNPNTYIISKISKPLKWNQYDKLWTDFWKKYGYAHKVEKIEKQKKQNGKYYDCHVTRWRADIVAHQFRHEYVCMLCMAEVPEEIAIQLVGHANANMIHEVYMSLKPKMISSAGEKLDAFLNK